MCINMYVLNYYTLVCFACFCFIMLIMLGLNNTKAKKKCARLLSHQTAFEV